MADTDDILDSETVEELGELTELDSERLPEADELDFEQLGPLVEAATSLLESVTDGEHDPEDGTLQALLQLVGLIKQTLDTTDAEELLDIVDLDAADEVVDIEELPDALASGDLGEAVELQGVRKLIEFGQLWDAVDLTELMDSKGEISETVGQITDDEGDGGVLDVDLFDEMELDDMTGDEEGVAGGLTDPEMVQAATQAQLDDAIDGFRELLVETHARLDSLREANKERFEGVDQPTSRNPTAVSTLSTHGGPPKAASAVSTVPRNVRHSTGASRRRIYGRRFEQLMAEKRDEEPPDDDQTAGEGGETR